MTHWSLEQEVVKAALSAGVAAVTLGLGWFIGQRLSAMWALRQKLRELDLSSAAEFARLYGEFVAIWKLWNYLREGSARGGTEDVRWSLMQRAADMEAGFEALLVRVCSERTLNVGTCDKLGLLRQAFQHLRECLRKNESVAWSRSEHPQYLAFKQLACLFENLLASDRKWTVPTAESAARALKEITSNRHEDKWAKLCEARVP